MSTIRTLESATAEAAGSLTDFVYLRLAPVTAELVRRTEAAKGGIDAATVHALRVATRRTRSALRSFRPLLPERLEADYGGDLRRLARVLGAVRDLDVYRERYLRRAAKLARKDRAALARHERYLDAQRERAVKALVESVHGGRCMRAVTELAAAISRGPDAAADPGPSAAAGAAAYVARARAEVLEDGRAIEARSAPKRLHRLRIQDKRFRYLLEFVEPLYGERLTPAIRAAVRLQDVLGRHQDASTAEAKLRDYALTVSPKEDGRAELLSLGQLIEGERRAARTARRRFFKEWPTIEAAVRALELPA